jgi:hypothetical protein
VVEGNGNDSVTAGNGDNLIVAGLGKHTVRVGNGSNVLIDGSVQLTQPADSLRQVLDDWIQFGSLAADVAGIRSRLAVTFNSSNANRAGRQSAGPYPEDSDVSKVPVRPPAARIARRPDHAQLRPINHSPRRDGPASRGDRRPQRRRQARHGWKSRSLAMKASATGREAQKAIESRPILRRRARFPST